MRLQAKEYNKKRLCVFIVDKELIKSDTNIQ